MNRRKFFFLDLHGRPQEFFQGGAKKIFLPSEGLRKFQGGGKKIFKTYL
jgi:hypothetical protein